MISVFKTKLTFAEFMNIKLSDGAAAAYNPRIYS